jgi:hypothetical protein
MKDCVSAAGLRIVREVDSIGVGHTLFECKRETTGESAR